jgi:parvulin-like peptidyl-prolyl isomerase
MSRMKVAKPQNAEVFFARRASPRMPGPLTLALIGALVGLAAAGAGLFRTAERPATEVPPGYTALVNGQPILTSDFIEQVQSTYGTTFQNATQAQRRSALRQMIDAELIVQRGIALDIPNTDSDVRASIIDSVNAQAVASSLSKRPTDEVLQDYFRHHLAKYQSGGTMSFQDIVLHYGSYQNADQTLDQALSDAAEAVYQLRSGASTEFIMEHFGFADSGNSSADAELEFASKIHLGPVLFNKASALGDGEISDPVPQKDGVHVVLMGHRQSPSYTDFDHVRNNVYSDYVEDEKKKVQRENLQTLRKNATIILAPDQNE